MPARASQRGCMRRIPVTWSGAIVANYQLARRSIAYGWMDGYRSITGGTWLDCYQMDGIYWGEDGARRGWLDWTTDRSTRTAHTHRKPNSYCTCYSYISCHCMRQIDLLLASLHQPYDLLKHTLTKLGRVNYSVYHQYSNKHIDMQLVINSLYEYCCATRLRYV